MVGRETQPRTPLSVRPLHADAREPGRAQTEVHPAQLAAGVAAADRDLPAKRAASDIHLNPRPHGVTVSSRLPQPQLDPIPWCSGTRRRPLSDVAPELHVLFAIHHYEIEHAIQVEVDQCRTARAGKGDNAGGRGPLNEPPIV